ncbi:MAG: RluA family pseudouridine synthase [Endomicrobium sp.]|jgi:23S rRNA pseudouridine955/2504/2580 synthase/23S rRNA pseudouridine1911/1915/1917 synthase|nr:RluA family pseudouridine synthase [Endomicrobium sp.]
MVQNIETIYHDDDIVVVNKPSGIMVIPDQHTNEDKTLIGILKEQLNQKIWVIHRIDKDTSGVLVFARSAESHRNLSMQFESFQVYKKYIALLSGVLEEDEGIINKPILISGKYVSIGIIGKESVTKFKVLERFKSYTLVEAIPLTSRRHQVRIHFWSLGYPLAIDAEYGVSDPIMLSRLKRNYKVKRYETEKPLISRLTLHARSLTLTLPSSSVGKTFEAPFPKDFELTFKQLKKYDKYVTNKAYRCWRW